MFKLFPFTNLAQLWWTWGAAGWGWRWGSVAHWKVGQVGRASEVERQLGWLRKLRGLRQTMMRWWLVMGPGEGVGRVGKLVVEWKTMVARCCLLG